MSTPRFPLLWYTSGTPMTIGQRDCAMARYLEYHAGTHGTGFRRKATAVPLATGAAVHQGIELIGQWILDAQHAAVIKGFARRPNAGTVPDDVIAWAATEAAARYEHKARTRGLALTKGDLTAEAAVTQLILEQRTLIEAQVWLYAIVRLPFMLADHRLIDVEREESPVIDCTCGIGDWVADDSVHGPRGCRGIVAQGKADFIWERVIDSILVYEEFKTKATQNYGWDQSWEHSGQLFRNMEAASHRLGKDVSVAYVPVLYKGKRDRTDRDDKTTPKIQQSPLVYGWFDPGNGMAREADWSARYKWYDDWGKGHTLPRTYHRTPIWDESVPLTGPMSSDLVRNPNGVTQRPGASRVEQWVKGWILPAQWGELLKVLGPFPKPSALVEDYTQAMLTEEKDWRERVTALRLLKIYKPGDVYHDRTGTPLPSTQGVQHVISRSWNCTHFDGSSCMFKPVCHKEAGWEDLTTMVDPQTNERRYEVRTPHHQPEQAAFEQLGVVFPEGDDEDEDIEL